MAGVGPNPPFGFILLSGELRRSINPAVNSRNATFRGTSRGPRARRNSPAIDPLVPRDRIFFGRLRRAHSGWQSAPTIACGKGKQKGRLRRYSRQTASDTLLLSPPLIYATRIFCWRLLLLAAADVLKLCICASRIWQPKTRCAPIPQTSTLSPSQNDGWSWGTKTIAADDNGQVALYRLASRGTQTMASRCKY